MDKGVSDPSATAADVIGHVAFLYRTRQELASAFAGLIRHGAAAGEAVLVASTASSLADIQARVDSHQQQSAVLANLSSLGANPGRVLSMMRMFAHQHRGRAVRCLQQVTWPGRPAEELAEAARYEALTAEAVDGSPSATVLCAYDARADPRLVSIAKHSHHHVLQDGRWHDYTRLQRPAWIDGQAGPPLSDPPASAATLSFRTDQAQVREFAAWHALRAGLPEARVTDLVIAVGELAANTLVHTSGRGTITIWQTDQGIVCQVSDSGQISDPLAGTFRPDPTATTSHRGLWLVHQVADLVQIRTGHTGTTVRVHMRIAARPAAARSLGCGAND